MLLLFYTKPKEVVQADEFNNDFVCPAAKAIVDSFYPPVVLLVTQGTDMFANIVLKRLSEVICYTLPTVERRINLYINHKVFQEPAYHLLPKWPDSSEIVDDEVRCLLNPMISPSRRDDLSYRVFDTKTCGFDFNRLCRLILI